MFGDQIPLDTLFPADGDGPFTICEMRMTGLTNKGVVSYTHGRLHRSERHPGGALVGPGAMNGGCVATFNDRTYAVDPAPREPGGVTLIDEGIQRFSSREVDMIFVTVSGPHRMQDSEFTLTLRFGSLDGAPMHVPAIRNGNFLSATTPIVRGGQTTFSLTFLEDAFNPR